MATTISTATRLGPTQPMLGWLGFILFFFTANVFAGQVTLGWDTSIGAAGYRVHYGTTSKTYSANIDAGAATTTTIPNLKEGSTYYFAVRAYDSAGNQSSFSNEVSQNIPALSVTTSTTAVPVASISATSTSGIAPLLVTLNDTSTGTVSSRVWDLGDGTTSTAQSVVKTYNNPGTYTVKLTVTNAGGSSTTTKTISATASVPVVGFTATPTSGTVPLTVQVADTSTNATQWAWNFGDGTTSNLQNPPAHVYKTAGTYTISLTATGPGGTSTPKTMQITAKAAATASLPAPWVSADIGNVGVVGSAAYANGTYTIKGSGTDIWGNADAFRFAYQPLNGDGTIVTRITGLTNTQAFAKAGVMIRESLDANARHAMVALTPNNGVRFIYRSSTGGSSSVKAGASVAAPYWVKLVRAGNTFTAYQSPDGNAWTVIGGPITITMGTNVYVGLVTSSLDNTLLNTATMDNVNITIGNAATGALPSPWLSADIGNVGVVGSAAYANGTYTIKGSGTDIWGNADAFRFAYQPLNGDGTIVTRITGLTNTQAFAKAGVMIRESLDANARHAMVALTPNNGVRFIYRSSTGGSSSVKAGASVAAPYWVKLVRAGNTFTAYQSPDGNAWTVIGGPITITMGTNVYVGLVTSSLDNTLLNTATMTNMSVR